MVESYDEIQKFTVTELSSWLEDKKDITEDIITVVETNYVNGKTFVDLSDDDFKELFSLFGD
jgi:DNA-binding ferritin-like protein (Dps family)